MPLKVLCEKFAHTRFEPSGWTGNQQIGYAKSLMDYIFRWLNLRFLSGTQLSLFAGLGMQVPQLPASPSLIAESDLDEESGPSQNHLARLAEEVAKRPAPCDQPARKPARGRRHCARPACMAAAGGKLAKRTCAQGSRALSRIGRHARDVRDGRRTELLNLRRDHGAQRELLPLHELRLNERLQLKTHAAGAGSQWLREDRASLMGCKESGLGAIKQMRPGQIILLERRRHSYFGTLSGDFPLPPKSYWGLLRTKIT